MREKKWTPGPWHIGAIESGRLAVDGRNGEQVTGFVEEYDAYLIKAAPDLVEALEKMKDVLEPAASDFSDEEREAMDKTYSALAKAYGETNHD